MSTTGGRTTRVDARPSSEGRVLAALAEIDARLREREGAWKVVARQLDKSRRQLEVVVAQLQRTRSLAARPPRCEDDESFQWRQPALVQTEETLHARLLEQFEAGLEEAERRRVALHDEIAGLRHRKQTALSELRAAVRSKYEAALQAGRVPAITTAKSGACCGCAARLPPPVVEAVGRGAVMVCPGCDRLLCPSP